MPDMRTSDLLSSRAQFPILGKRLYFATQCLGPLPSTVEDDFEDYWRTLALRNRALEEWLLCMAEVTGLVENLLGAPGGTGAPRDRAAACQGAIAPAPPRVTCGGPRRSAASRWSTCRRPTAKGSPSPTWHRSSTSGWRRWPCPSSRRAPARSCPPRWSRRRVRWVPWLSSMP